MAIVTAPPEDLDGYVDVTMSLATNPAAYAARAAACGPLAEQFLNRARSYPAALDRVSAAIGHAPEVTSAFETVFVRLIQPLPTPLQGSSSGMPAAKLLATKRC